MRFITQDYYTKAAVILRILWVFGRQWHIGWDGDWARPAARYYYYGGGGVRHNPVGGGRPIKLLSLFLGKVHHICHQNME